MLYSMPKKHTLHCRKTPDLSKNPQRRKEMKSAKKLLLLILTIALTLSVMLSLASCDEVYTVDETDEKLSAIDKKIAELNEKITSNKSDSLYSRTFLLRELS